MPLRVRTPALLASLRCSRHRLRRPRGLRSLARAALALPCARARRARLRLVAPAARGVQRPTPAHPAPPCKVSVGPRGGGSSLRCAAWAARQGNGNRNHAERGCWHSAHGHRARRLRASSPEAGERRRPPSQKRTLRSRRARLQRASGSGTQAASGTGNGSPASLMRFRAAGVRRPRPAERAARGTMPYPQKTKGVQISLDTSPDTCKNEEAAQRCSFLAHSAVLDTARRVICSRD